MRGSSRLRSISLLFFLVWGMASLSGVEVEPDLRRIDPAVLMRENAPGIAPLRASGVEGTRNLPLSVFIRLAADDDALPEQVRNLGGTARKILPRIYAARLPADTTRYLSNRSSVMYIEADRIARPLLDASRPAVSADLVQQGSPPLVPPFLGNGTIVGIVDTGLDGSHPDFSGRISHTYTVSGTLNPLQDANGHGTHVTGIAAGDGAASSGTYTGMAPGAELFIGRAGAEFFTQSGIIEIMDNFLQNAQTTPIAINLSLGVIPGPHDGTSSFETLINARAADTSGPRRIIAVAAGNERGTNEHYGATVPPFGVVNPAVRFATGATLASVELWADGEDEYLVNATMGTDTAAVPSGTAGGSSSGRISVSNKVSLPPNGDTLISVTFRPLAGTSSATIRLTRTRNGGNGVVDGYIDRFDGTFQGASIAGTITEPANAADVLSIGSFNSKTGGGSGPVDDDSTFSSLGPTRDGRIKPDIMAPGSLISSARSGQATYLPIEIVDDNYVILQGTSMATAHVTGIASLVWESNPSLTGAQMRERLKATADPPSDGTAAPNTTWGFGRVNAWQAVTLPVASITAPATAAPGSQVQLTSANSSGPLGAAITEYHWTVPGMPVPALSDANTTFLANAPGNYVVSLFVTSDGTDSLPVSKTIHVNTIPVALIDGPVSDNVGLPVTFTGTSSSAQDTGQVLTYRWVLVSRPANSHASLPTGNLSSVSFTADAGGAYVIGLRVDDGLDNSVLATRSYTAIGGSSSGSDGGGGGGCVIGLLNGEGDEHSSPVTLLLILLPFLYLRARKAGCLPWDCRGRNH